MARSPLVKFRSVPQTTSSIKAVYHEFAPVSGTWRLSVPSVLILSASTSLAIRYLQGRTILYGGAQDGFKG